VEFYVSAMLHGKIMALEAKMTRHPQISLESSDTKSFQASRATEEICPIYKLGAKLLCMLI